MDKKNIGIVIVVAVVVGAAGFFGGMQYAKAKTPARTPGNGQFAFGGGQGQTAGGAAGRRTGGAGAVGGAFLGGQILSKDSSSLTIQLPNNAGTKIVFFSGSTQVSKPSVISASDLQVGDNVIISGTAGSDGSETAQTIQVRPAMTASSTPSRQ